PPPPPAPPPAPPGTGEYRVQPGDLLEIRVFGHRDLSTEVRVGPDGFAFLELVGMVEAAGHGLNALAGELELRYGTYLRDPAVQVRLREAARPSVMVVGRLPRSGRRELVGRGTVLEVLTDAGWTPGGPAQRVSVLRGERVVGIDLRALVEGPDPSLNLPLAGGDLVLVQEEPPVQVLGAVGRPGVVAIAVPVVPVRQAVMLAGGLGPAADPRGARLIRADGTEEALDLNRVLLDRGGALAGALFPRLSPGDALYVPASAEQRVYVLGMVGSPGLYRQREPWTVSQALAFGRLPTFGAVLSEVKVVRDFPGDPTVYSVDVDRLLFRGDMSQNFPLEDGDVVFVPESTSSDVLEFLTKALQPFSQGITTASSVKDFND
ncbi:MAG: polysaccharide biosynthesis/export family protein, partial [Planctomycetes bacterium]|nr:polysaccharide biosynthesis/export family protein [Planctomycetota bacterium]